MKPANGPYSLTTLPQPGVPSTTVRYEVTDEGIPTTFGLLVWVELPPPGMFVHGDVALRFLDEDSFVAINGADSYEGSYAPA
jgi:hypothetical protein